MQTVLITGGTGLVGKALTEYLLIKGYKIIILTRQPDQKKDKKSVTYAAWDITSGYIDISAVKEADYIIHLAGAGIMDRRWTRAYQMEIIDSRVKSGNLIAQTLQNNEHKVKGIISSSGTGWYTDNRSETPSKEEEPAADDFLGEVCKQWENAFVKSNLPGVAICNLRCGIILSKNGGALSEFKKSLRFGIAAIMGPGTQKISWIHIDDICRLYHHALINNLTGSYNAVSNENVSNKNFIHSMAHAFRPRSFIPVFVPGFILRLLLGKRTYVLLKSTNAGNSKIHATDFNFLYPDLKTAFQDLAAK